ncbi:MAG: NAD(P)-dependent oxidoreductase [Alphaproteobacteria bacterium]|nr:NAD(P)-dependent oxidoreductase [Alphaproteobacteria bacterium]
MPSPSIAVSPAGLRIGVLGLGNIGRAVADNLTAAGFTVTSVRRPSTADFPRLTETAADLARTSDIVIAALATESAMRSAYLAPDGLIGGAHAGLCVIDLGTFPVELKQELADRLATTGAAMLDSPISGTPPVVRDGRGVLFVSGDAEAIARCQPILDAIAPVNHHVGKFGAGMAVKLAANLLVIIDTMATAHAVLLGTRSGIDPQMLITAIGSSFAGTPVFRQRAPLMAERRYRPAAGPSHVMAKDLGYIDAACRRLGIAAPLLAPTMQWFDRLIDAGRGNDEGAAIFELLEAASTPAP